MLYPGLSILSIELAGRVGPGGGNFTPASLPSAFQPRQGFAGVAGGVAGGLLNIDSSTGVLLLISVYLRVAVDP